MAGVIALGSGTSYARQMADRLRQHQQPPSTPIQTMPQPVKHARRCICGARPKPDGTLPCDH